LNCSNWHVFLGLLNDGILINKGGFLSRNRLVHRRDLLGRSRFLDSRGLFDGCRLFNRNRRCLLGGY
jgi:hypothetical protein